MQWGHVASKNLVDWIELPPALVPDQWYDAHGVWDGSMTVVDGVPHLIYSCLPSNGTNMVCIAHAADPADPMLTHWTKSPLNPVISSVPTGGNRFDFRDPAVFTYKNATMIAISSSFGTGSSGAGGGNPNRNGSVVVYTAKSPADLTAWGHVGDGVLFNSNQFGSAVIECVDLFPLAASASWVLRFQPDCNDLYMVGRLNHTNRVGLAFEPVDRPAAGYPTRLIDGGLFCASRTFAAPGDRRLLFGAINCDLPTMLLDCGYCGVASIPREITLASTAIAVDNMPPDLLAVNAATEIELLRGRKLVGTRATLDPSTSGRVAVMQSTNGSTSFDLVLHVRGLGPNTRSFTVRVREFGDEYAEVAVDWLDAALVHGVDFPGGDYGVVTISNVSQRVAIDGCMHACTDSPQCVAWSLSPATSQCFLKRTVPSPTVTPGVISGNLATFYLATRRQSAGATTSTRDRIVRLPAVVMSTPTATWRFRVLVDGSLIEVFAFNGTAAMTSRFYPKAKSNAAAASLGLAEGPPLATTVDVWAMGT
jgi:sucrose-6-phosphate hydrolase SacC (GH32 family)